MASTFKASSNVDVRSQNTNSRSYNIGYSFSDVYFSNFLKIVVFKITRAVSRTTPGGLLKFGFGRDSLFGRDVLL